MQCRFIDSGFNDAFTNMAIDEAILSNPKIPTLRMYQWKPFAVSLGYGQNIKEINIDYCKKNNIDIVRRITGGKAVFHKDELTYSFIVPNKSKILPEDITESYKKISEALIIAFRDIGIEAEMEKIPERVKTSICFNSSNWYEILVNERKISGSAQKRIDNKVLQHGSLILDFDFEKNKGIFGTDEKLDNRITSIKKEIKKEIEIEKLKRSIKNGFEKIFGFEFIEDGLTKEETKLASDLIKNKYSAKEWNFEMK